MQYRIQPDSERSRQIELKSRGKVVDKYEMAIYEFDMNDFLDRSILFIGGSESGKTTLMLYVMHELRHQFPRVCVFSRSNSENHTYDGIIPDILIYDKPTKEILEDIWDLASEATNTYNRVHQYKPMYSLFRRVANRGECMRFKSLQNEYHKAIRRICAANKRGIAEALCNKLKKKFDKKIVIYMKTVVARKRRMINAAMLKTPEEKFTYHYLTYNPRTLMIFDDCTVELGKLMTSKNKTIENLFYRGRHKFITHFYAIHTDKKFPSEVRQNAFVTILTDGSSANSYFGHKNGLTKQEQDTAKAIIQDVYNHEYEKLVYLRKKDFPEKFQSIKADLVGKFRMCSPIVWQYNNIIKKKSKIEKTKLTNKFERFVE